MAEADADLEDANKPDRAAITSVLRWNRALSLMRPEEVVRVLETFQPEHSTVELVRMLLHDNPSASVVELVSRSQDLSDAILSRLPNGTSQPSQQFYAITGISVDDSAKNNLFGEVFELDNDTALPAERTAFADLLITSNLPDDMKSHDDILERFMKLAKPDALLVTVPGSHFDSSKLESKGFQALIGGGSTKKPPNLLTSSARKSMGLTNGAYSDKTSTTIVVLESSNSSVESKAFASALRDIYQGQDYNISVLNCGELAPDDHFDGKTCLSLLELEQPLLVNLSETDFLKIKAVVLSCDRLL